MTWRWPWVHRSRVEAAQIVADQRLDELGVTRGRLAAVERKYEQAVELFHDLANRALQMRKEGFAPIEPPAPPPPEPMPAEVEAAIAERAVSPELDRHLRRWARQELTATAPDKVAARILQGVAETEEEL